MVHQTIDSKFGEYVLANAEPGLPKHDKQLSVPVAAKKTTALKDLQNENLNTMLNSVGSSLFQKESRPLIAANKISGIKRPPPECLVSSHQHQSPTNNAASGHLVYVRRKPEAELGKSSICNSTSNNVDCPQSRKLGDQDGKVQQQSQMKDSKICIPEAAPILRASSVSFLSGKPSIPLPLGKSNNTLPPADSNYLHITSSISSLDYPKRMNVQHWEERYCRLQNLLKILDQSIQEDYVQMLRSLSSVELSRHAVELEKRSIQLSLEEGEEMQRVRLLDVLAKYPKNSRPPSIQQNRLSK